ncbi:MAG: LLM class flavin-dependent oxidoreductase [Anaerolineales bacterium]|nr:LLM class flavin-dependent oxidoreductase [Anaerolineales bacterium]
MIKFGVRIPEFATDGSSVAQLRAQADQLLEAGRGRFASAWVSDHFVPWSSQFAVNTENLEAWTTLTYFCGRHPDYTFGNIVLAQSYRAPALLAKMATTLQALSGGRLILALGAGWKEDEYRAYGYDFPAAATRIQQLAEAAQIIRLMFTEPSATFHGRHYHVDRAVCAPKGPFAPPLMLAGHGRQLTLRVVARYADWWNGVGGPAGYADTLDALRGHCRAVGRDYDGLVKTWMTDCVAIAPTTAAARALAEAHPFYNPDAALVGTPTEVAAQLRRFVGLGVEHFILRFADFPQTAGVELFGREVIPLFG